MKLRLSKKNSLTTSLVAAAGALILSITAVGCTSSSDGGASSASSASSGSGPIQVSGAGAAGVSGTELGSDVTAPSSAYAGGTPAVPSDGAPASAAAPPAESVTAQPPVSTSGPAPAAGDINQEVPAVEVTTNPAVPFDATADFGGQVTAKLAALTPVQASANLPGEISGPAVAVTVEITNGSNDPIGLDSVTVDLTDGAGNPALPMTSDPAKPLAGVLAPGAQTTGVYVFTAPLDARTNMALTVSYSAGAPTILFTGSVSGG